LKEKHSVYLTARVSEKTAQKFQQIKEKLGLESNAEVIRHLISKTYQNMVKSNDPENIGGRDHS